MASRPNKKALAGAPSTVALLTRYWLSRDSLFGWGLLVLLAATISLFIYSLNELTDWQKTFFDAIGNRNKDMLPSIALQGLLILALFIPASSLSTYFQQWLQMEWRNWMTRDYMQRWLQSPAYHYMGQSSNSNDLNDNPDQRVAEDVSLLVEKVVGLGIGFVKNLANIIIYTLKLWAISSVLEYYFFVGEPFKFRGLLIICTVLFVLFGSLIMEKLVKPMVSVDYQRQRHEADFRHSLFNIRDNAEQIAFYRGHQHEKRRALHHFSAIYQNWRQLMRFTRRRTLTENVYMQMGNYFPYLFTLPSYFNQLISLGDVMQLNMACARLRSSLSWFVYNYEDLATVRATLLRLREFEAQLESPINSSFRYQPSPDGSLQLLDVQLNRPDGSPVNYIDALVIKKGQRCLLQGPSGGGKSTILRTLAQLWPYGSGTVQLPNAARMLFLPQKSYIAEGTLKEALTYPKLEAILNDQDGMALLTRVGLGHYASELNTSADWSKSLSPGEQQRLAFARALYTRPDYLFLDEATSALDARAEWEMYTLVLTTLPHITLLSVAHHAALRSLHSMVIDLPSKHQDIDAYSATTEGVTSAL